MSKPPSRRPPGSGGRPPSGPPARPRGSGKPGAPATDGPRPPRRTRPAGEALATNLREVRALERAAGQRPARPRRRQPGDAPAAAPTGGRRGRGEARAAARAAERASAPVTHEPQRIAKLLARAGVGSRRDIERMIAEGKVAIGGKVLETPAHIVTSLDGVTVVGHAVAPIEATRLFAFHKPPGFLTTARDPGGRPTIFDILPPGLPRLVPVGRLDMNTEGLLLMTTDGALKRALELPSSAVSRRYRVRAYGDISQAALESLAEGITIDGVRYGPIEADIEIRTGRNLWIAMRLTEGKNREIRRVLEFLGLQVSRLIRVAYGPIDLADLPPRAVGELPAEAVTRLKASLPRGGAG